MKIKNISMAVMAIAALFTSCLDTEPVSSITDANYWQTAEQYNAYNVGLHSQLRNYAWTFFKWGELRSNLYEGTPITGQNAVDANLWDNTLSASSTNISNFGDLYSLINQVNNMIDHAETASSLNAAKRGQYLGAAYGMRAYIYFHLLRCYGGVVLQTSHTEGSDIQVGNMSKAAASAAEVMTQIKKDLSASEEAYGSDLSFANGRVYWSLPATLMLKGQVYLWSANQMSGGTADLQTAKSALEKVKGADVALLDSYSQVFSAKNKQNKEIIFAFSSNKDELYLLSDKYRANFTIDSNFQGSFYKADGTVLSADVVYSERKGSLFESLNAKLYSQLWREGDSRRDASLLDLYQKQDDGSLKYVGNVANKYQGEIVDGGSFRVNLEDYPIYRYAECLLTLAAVKALLGESPADEINAVRRRAYGSEYFEAHQSELAYPNDTEAAFYADNAFEASDANAQEAVLKEQLREFLFEGHRWYDLRAMGDNYCTKYSTANAQRLLWPIDVNTLSENKLLQQTPGY